MRGLVILMTLVAMLAGCGRAASVTTPESIIEAVFAACREAKYADAVPYFEGGPENLESAPQWVRDFMERISDRGNALTFEVIDRMERGETLLLQINTYSDAEMKSPLRTSVWHFTQTKSGWIVTEVE